MCYGMRPADVPLRADGPLAASAAQLPPRNEKLARNTVGGASLDLILNAAHCRVRGHACLKRGLLMDTSRSPTRRLRIFLRDFRMVEATVNLADGQALASYFANRRSYVNLRGAHWAGTGDDVAHVALKVDQVLWAAAPEGDVPLTNASVATRGHDVEIQLDGGLLVAGGLMLSEQQRLSDYLETGGQFVPVLNAQLLRSGRPPKKVNLELGDIVVNQEAIQAVWEVAAQDPRPVGPEEPPQNPLDPGGADWR
jgi:hypothetical protein